MTPFGQKRAVNPKNAAQATEAEKNLASRAPGEPKSNVVTPSLVRGMRDILPQEQFLWESLMSAVQRELSSRGFERIETPMVEEAGLFLRTLGKTTDIVEKEMFLFEDPGGNRVVLRPEATASVARAYIKHGMLSLPQPVRLWYWGAMFRHDRPQSGRYRQFFQAGAEVLGDKHPSLDAQLIMSCIAILRRVRITATVIINSTGCPVCRPQYMEQLSAYYRSKRSQLCQDCKRRLLRNPLRLLDCKEEQCQSLKYQAPQIVDSLCAECKEHFVRVLEYCDELDIRYQLDSTLVRGLDYYTKTVFELYQEGSEPGRQDALGGGGRYDGLITALGGRETPGVGFSLGADRIVNAMREQWTEEERTPPKPQLFFAQLGEQARRRALKLIEGIRAEGFRVAEQFSKDGLKVQLEHANRLGVAYTLILGQKEVLDGTILVRDMEGGVQEIVDSQKIVEELKKKLSK